MKALMILLALSLTGCTTIESVRNDGARSTHALRQSPTDAGGCFARNVERDRPGIQTYVRSAGNGAMEVIVRNGPDVVLAVAEIAPVPGGSNAQIWLKPSWFYRRDEFIPAMIKDC